MQVQTTILQSDDYPPIPKKEAGALPTQRGEETKYKMLLYSSWQTFKKQEGSAGHRPAEPSRLTNKIYIKKH